MNLSRALLLLTLAGTSAFAGVDKAGCADHPLIPTRMPGYWLEKCKTMEFDGYDFFTAKPPKHREEGKLTVLTYAIDRKDEQSALAVVRNFENAIKNAGGTVTAIDLNRRVNGKVVVDGKEIWVEAEKGNGKIWLNIIEKQAMEQHIVADAASFASGLKATGHVSVDGIFFDTGKSVLKPESTPALVQVAKLLAR